MDGRGRRRTSSSVGGVSTNGNPADDKFPSMARQRPFYKESPSWLDASEVFTDTQRVDLFNDPRWETTVRPSARRVMADEPRGGPRGTIAKALAFRRVLMKRGRHSRNPV